MPDFALEAESVAKVYRRSAPPALSGVDLRIPTGSITALVGPNGAGKSTLMKAWVGFERPTLGRVLVHGADPFASRKAALRRIGYIAQQPALYREFSVADHLDLARSLRASFDRKLAERRLHDLGVPTTRLAGQLSGGQQAQVSLAIVLATGADTLLLDEPLAALDPLARREFIYVLAGHIRERGGTAVLTSHIATDVEQAADRLVVLEAGKAILDADVAAALATHQVGPVDPPMRPGVVRVGSFLGRTEFLTLIRIEADDRLIEGFRAATIEELMLGYLAAGRPGVADRALNGAAGQ